MIIWYSTTFFPWRSFYCIVQVPKCKGVPTVHEPENNRGCARDRPAPLPSLERPSALPYEIKQHCMITESGVRGGCTYGLISVLGSIGSD